MTRNDVATIRPAAPAPAPARGSALDAAADRFAALGHPQRLAILLALVRAGSEGLGVGALRQLSGGGPATSFAHHLRALAGAGLVLQAKRGREVVSRADYGALQGLGEFILRDCCSGMAEAAGEAAPGACCLDGRESGSSA